MPQLPSLIYTIQSSLKCFSSERAEKITLRETENSLLWDDEMEQKYRECNRREMFKACFKTPVYWNRISAHWSLYTSKKKNNKRGWKICPCTLPSLCLLKQGGRESRKWGGRKPEAETWHFFISRLKQPKLFYFFFLIIMTIMFYFTSQYSFELKSWYRTLTGKIYKHLS